MTQGINKSSDNLDETKPNHPIEPDPFDQILRTADFGFDRTDKGLLENDEIKLLGPDELLDWPFDDDNGASNCDEAVQIPKYLKAVNFPIRDSLLNSARNSASEKGSESDLPDWLTASSNNNDLFAQNGLPKATRNTIPEWMKDYNSGKENQDNNLSAYQWKPDPEAENNKKKFDPNKTQKVKAYKKQNKAYITLVAVILYFTFTLFAGSFFSFRFDELISSILGVYLYTIAQEHGYDLKFLLPHKK